jgi:phospholipid/cholesterol/gamma-HCH transport system substrate-binding protein
MILAGVVLLYLSLTWVKSIHLFAVDRSNYKLRFQDVSGLKEGDAVTVYGYPSGNVEDIRIEGQGAVVTINLSEDIAVQTDASALIKVKEIMGGKLIELNPGRSGIKLQKDHYIPGDISLDFSSAFAKTGEFLDKFDVSRIDTLMGDVTKLVRTFSRMTDELDTLDTQGMVKDLRESAGSLNHILADVERRKIVEDIDNSLDKVNQLAEKAEESLNSISQMTDRINARTLPKADSILTQVNDMLGSSEGMIDDVKKLLKQFQDRSTLAGQLLYDPGFAKQVDGTLKNLDKTLDHIRTKKIYVTMTLSKGQRLFDEEIEDEGGKEKKGQ